MKNIKTIAIAATFALTVGAGAALAASYPGQQYASRAHIAIAQARATVTRLVPNGTITAQELEREAGGSGWRYSFEVKTAAGTREVGIDAQTGKVLENGAESASSESGETPEAGESGAGDNGTESGGD